ncbi:cell division protein FtsZ [Nitrosospira lacus]|uniref:Cell division protein ZipA n=2 Tax=Nitrosospira lacus TaxID=1288494 RepID=A0A1W6SNA1_9PROT|nr:cell division protein FtsZ [Nitrosospira lacus]
MADMSELQISLIAIGFVVVLGVVLFNWMQQRRYRRGAEEAFARKHEDVLLKADTSVAEDERVEPQLGKELLRELQGEPEAEPQLMEIPQPDLSIISAGPDDSVTSAGSITLAGSAASHEIPVGHVDVMDTVDYIANIRAQTSIADAELAEVLQRKFDFSKPVRWLGQRNADTAWEEITIEKIGKGGFIGLKGCLQLADRAGPVSEVSLSEFHDMVQNFATRVNAVADCPNVRQAYALALSLDQFCAEVDVMIGINIISRDNSVFTGAKIQVLAEASGFKLGTNGIFSYRDENNSLLFSLNNHESSPFLPDSVRTITTHGITFLLDVPRVANGEKIFDEMTHLAEIFSDALGGMMVDDNHTPLSDSGIGKIKQQLSAIQALMQARKIPAGSEIALRLFA